MFVFSFKAKSIRVVCIVCLCIIAAIGVITLLPDAGSSLNVNKLDISGQLNKINVKNESGRLEYLFTLGYNVEREPVSTSSEKLPKVMDAATERYNDLQRSQGFDLSKYCGKKLTSYTYKVSSFPDGTKPANDTYLATLVVHKNKVVAADLCCPSLDGFYPLVRLT